MFSDPLRDDGAKDQPWLPLVLLDPQPHETRSAFIHSLLNHGHRVEEFELVARGGAFDRNQDVFSPSEGRWKAGHIWASTIERCGDNPLSSPRSRTMLRSERVSCAAYLHWARMECKVDCSCWTQEAVGSSTGILPDTATISKGAKHALSHIGNGACDQCKRYLRSGNLFVNTCIPTIVNLCHAIQPSQLCPQHWVHAEGAYGATTGRGNVEYTPLTWTRESHHQFGADARKLVREVLRGHTWLHLHALANLPVELVVKILQFALSDFYYQEQIVPRRIALPQAICKLVSEVARR